MIEHKFENFNDYEFEILCRDLLNEDHRINIKSKNGIEGNIILQFGSFKKGKDHGIDLYYKAEGITVIGQVKYSSGNFSDLMRAVKKRINGVTEADKVKLQNPDKYVFMTSVPLSLDNKKAICNYFSPYIKSEIDIYGREDLNRLLSQFRTVERRHVKLYFTNPLVLEHLQTYATISRSRFMVGEILENVKNFVQTTNFNKALYILDTERLLIIKGLPGVGKTTLAKLLSLYYIEQGYEFVEIRDLDNEIESLLDLPGKQIFYYDDFLGSNNYLIKDALKNEERISHLIRRIARNNEKALILTTRNNILKNAEYISDKLPQLFFRMSKFEVDTTDLLEEEKTEILSRHITKNNLDCELFTAQLFKRLVHHPNFSPRLIEFITDSRNVQLNIVNYQLFALQSLDNPKEIWAFAYREQITLIDRVFLNHLFLFGNSCAQKIFQKSFENRMNFQARHGNYQLSHDEFRKSTSTMDGTFITVTQQLYGNKEEFLLEFINPSIADFIIREIKINPEFITLSIMSFDRHEILMERFNHSRKDLLKLLDQSKLEDTLLQKQAFKVFESVDEQLTFLTFLKNYFTSEKIEAAFSDEISIFLQINLPYFSPEDYLEFLIEYKELKVVQDFVLENYILVFTRLLREIRFEGTFNLLQNAFDNFNLDYKIFLLNDEARNNFYKTFTTILEDSVDQYLFVKQDNLFSENEVEKLYGEVNIEFKRFFKKIDGAEEILTQLLDSRNWNEIIRFNEYKNSGMQ